MNTIANDPSQNEPTAHHVDPPDVARRVELGDDTGEIPLALMQQILAS